MYFYGTNYISDTKSLWILFRNTQGQVLYCQELIHISKWIYYRHVFENSVEIFSPCLPHIPKLCTSYDALWQILIAFWSETWTTKKTQAGWWTDETIKENLWQAK